MPKLFVKMVRQYSIETVLRLITLHSVIKNGLEPGELEYFRKAFLMCYGYQEIPTLMNLQDAKLLKHRNTDDKNFVWETIKESFGLIKDRVDV